MKPEFFSCMNCFLFSLNINIFFMNHYILSKKMNGKKLPSHYTEYETKK